MKSNYFTLFLLVLLLFPVVLHSQENWTWGYQGTNDNYCNTEIGTIDKLNNSYAVFPYDSKIVFKDTVFQHNGSAIYHPNFALVKLDKNGKFINALDFYSITQRILEYNFVADNELNLFVILRFSGTFTINGIEIHEKTGSTDLVLLKFNPDFELVWYKYIYSGSSDYCRGMFTTHDNGICIYTNHEGAGHQNISLNLLGQDSTTFKGALLSFIKIDSQGDILWRKEINSNNLLLIAFESYIDINDNIYITGGTTDSLYFNNDTLVVPKLIDGNYYLFDIVLRPDGTLKKISIADIHIYPKKHADSDGNYYFTLNVYDTLVFGGDTLIASQGNYISLIGKLDSNYNPIWYKKMIYSTMTGYSFTFKSTVNKDTLYYFANCFGSFIFNDSTYSIGSNESILYGKFTPEGVSTDLNFASCTNRVRGLNISVDKCGQSYLSGYFQGVFITGNDTLYQTNHLHDDGFIAKITNCDVKINLGNDTTITKSESITLTVPDSFSNIIWSTGDTSHSIIVLGNSLQEGINQLWVNAYQENCFVTDTIIVYVINNSGISINNEIDVHIYPNPANDYLIIQTDPDSHINNIKIFNQLGQLVYNPKELKNKIDVSKIQHGIYIISFEFHDRIIKNKLIIK